MYTGKDLISTFLFVAIIIAYGSSIRGGIASHIRTCTKICAPKPTKPYLSSAAAANHSGRAGLWPENTCEAVLKPKSYTTRPHWDGKNATHYLYISMLTVIEIYTHTTMFTLPFAYGSARCMARNSAIFDANAKMRPARAHTRIFHTPAIPLGYARAHKYLRWTIPFEHAATTTANSCVSSNSAETNICDQRRALSI